MPIDKILITHKFGIISQSHKRQLQERLIKQKFLLECQEKQKKKDPNDLINLQINEDFVKEYNESSSEKKLKLNQKCTKIFEKIKLENLVKFYLKILTVKSMYLNYVGNFTFILDTLRNFTHIYNFWSRRPQ
ncbi:transmembrane protein -like [Brachionus plicatilis]|uniref:Transmembrane protein-like n=1 Tax=Brachionus plicatilis TaxID=10195 RepID=A0A3M7S672_BRAPC|nr:transmembrane protein -like [Brachionus plicatilis]